MVAPLRSVPSVKSEGGLLEVTLVMDIITFHGPYSFNTRAYNYSIPGPTLRLKKGDLLRIT